jgi:hypothetical protein
MLMEGRMSDSVEPALVSHSFESVGRSNVYMLSLWYYTAIKITCVKRGTFSFVTALIPLFGVKVAGA